MSTSRRITLVGSWALLVSALLVALCSRDLYWSDPATQEPAGPAKTPLASQEGEMNRGARVPIPKLLGGNDPPLDDQRSNEYDPATLARGRQKRVADIFRDETRDPLWATAHEGQVRAIVEGDLNRFPGSKLAEIECRQYACRVVVEVPAKDFPIYRSSRQRVGNVGSTDALEQLDGVVRWAHISILRKEYRDPVAFEEAFMRKRTRQRAD